MNRFFKKTIITLMALVSVISLNSVSADADWRSDSKGWFYVDGAELYTGWKNIDNKWYYFYLDGYMAHDITIDGYYLNSSGAWVGSSSVNMGDKILGRWYGLYMDRSVPDSITKNTICGNVYNIVEDRGDSLIIDVYYNDGTSDRHMIHYIDENTMTMYLYNNYTKIYTGCSTLTIA